MHSPHVPSFLHSAAPSELHGDSQQLFGAFMINQLAGDSMSWRILFKRERTSTMAKTAAQIWKCTKLSIERLDDEESGAVTFSLFGPLTARDMYCTLSPVAFQKLFETPTGAREPQVHHLDLSQVPYMDSSGIDMLMTHSHQCWTKGIRMTVSGTSPQVLELIRNSKLGDLFQPHPAL